MTAIGGVAVGIPAHNEAAHIEAALESILRAAEGILPVVVVVAADSCDDATADIARRRLRRLPPNVQGAVVELAARSVGSARARACEEADAWLQHQVSEPTMRWIATTDADTMVPIGWISTHRRWARCGADAVAGLVQIDPSDPLRAPVRQALDRELARAGLGHGHIYGANLGVTAAWWHRIGGFPALDTREDVVFVERLREARARVIGAPDSVVVTSGRLQARAPRGFGSKLAALTELASRRG